MNKTTNTAGCFVQMLVVSLLCPILSSAQSTYYVATNGNNANPGTLAHPWRTPGYGSRRLHTGDTLIIRGGRYIVRQYDDDIMMPTSGTATAWVTIKGEDGNRPVIAGRSNLFSAIIIGGRSYVRLENIEITRDNTVGAPACYFRGGVSITGDSASSNIVLKGLYIHHIDEGAVDAQDVRYLTITNCVFAYCGFGAIGGPAGAHGGLRNVSVRNCRLSYSGHYYQGGNGSSRPYDRPDGFGIEPSAGPVEIVDTISDHNYGDGLDSKSANTLIRRCIVANNSCDGVKLWDGGSRVENTLIYGRGDGNTTPTPWSPIVIGNAAPSNPRFDLVHVAVDDLLGGNYLMHVQYDNPTVPVQLNIRNCIFRGVDSPIWVGGGSTLNADHSLFYLPGRPAAIVIHGGNTYGSNNIASLGAGNRCADPMFVAPAWGSMGDYHLRAASAAVNLGATNGAPTDDLDLRRRDSRPDAGAYEFVTNSRGRRSWPDSSSNILVFADQLQESMSTLQRRFAATNLVGTQKMRRSEIRAIRAYNTNFLCLHYQLALGCGPAQFIIGDAWTSDWSIVNNRENGFMHNASSQRVHQTEWNWDVMNITYSGGMPNTFFPQYWITQCLARIRLAESDGVFADSYTVDTLFDQLNPSHTWFHDTAQCKANWILSLNKYGAAIKTAFEADTNGFLFLPNLGGLITSWDTTDYGVGHGGMIECFAMWGYSNYFDVADWHLQMDRALSLVRSNKIVICQSYTDTANYGDRMFALASYLLIKGSRTYFNMVTVGDLEYYPEYKIALGSALSAPASGISQLWQSSWGVYRRNYAKGIVLVNPGDTPVTIGNLGAQYRRVVATGGGAVDQFGHYTGSLSYSPVGSLTMPAHSGAVLLSGSGGGRRIIVAPSGGNYTTIQAALNVARPGDTVTVRTAVYNEKLVFPSSGTASGRITLCSYPGEKPILDGTNRPGRNMILLNEKSWIRIEGFEIRNNTNLTDGSGIRLLGACCNVQVVSNVIHNMRGSNAMAITVYGTNRAPASNLLIRANHIYNCDAAPSEALTLNGNITDFEVSSNTVHDINNIGIDFIGGETDVSPYGVCRRGVCRGNHVYRARSNYGGGYAAGIYVDGGKDIVVERNIVHECNIGMEIGCENAGYVVTGVVVRANVVYNNDKAGIGFGGYAAGVGRVRACQFLNNTCYKNDTRSDGNGELWIQHASNNLVANNIFFCGPQNLLMADAGASANRNNKLDYNLWYSEAGNSNTVRFAWRGATYSGFPAYRSGSGQDLHSLWANPRLVNGIVGALDAHIQAGSPAINAGDPAYAPPANVLDMDGQARVQGGRVDIGADERAGGGWVGTNDLVFIHHSVGENWLNDGLDAALVAKRYVDERNDITYGTDMPPDSGRPDSLGSVPGDLTDMNHWIRWFNDYFNHVRAYGAANGFNQIIVFKSCFPNSDIWDNGTEPGDPFSDEKTFANYKAVYRHPGGRGRVYSDSGYAYKPLEDIFAAHPDTLFIPVTAPALNYAPSDATTDANAHRARLFNNWLKGAWLASYNAAHPGLNNVAVFDFFNILAYPDNHASHPNRLKSEYGGASGDSHPNTRANATSTWFFATGPTNFLDIAWALFSSGGEPLPMAVYVGTNKTTQGNWKGVYGADGYNIINNSTSYPSYAKVIPSGHRAVTWAASTSDRRALLKAAAGSTNRIAACWYSTNSFILDLNLTNWATHRVALYCLDWTRQGRAQRIDILDASSGARLDSRTVSGFTNGVYLVWDIRGHVKVRVTKTAGPNAVLSGLFFGPRPAGTSVAAGTFDARGAVMNVNSQGSTKLNETNGGDTQGDREREAGAAPRLPSSGASAPSGPWVWTSGNCSDEYPANHLIDGDTNTLWIGDATGTPWRVILDWGAVKDVRGLDVLFQDAPWTNMGIIGSQDSAIWFDYLAETNEWMPLRYLHLNFWGDEHGTNPPAIREIFWRDR